MTSAITATWPNGVYLGHTRDGSPEALPSFSRLFSALTHAAATGVSSWAEADDGSGIPSAAERALRWLEMNPPTGMYIPPHRTGRRYMSKAFRKEGVFRIEGGGKKYKVTERLVGEGTALGGPVAWVWDEPFPDDVAATLDRICCDVGCLGEASSMVILEIDSNQPATHRITKTRSFFEAGGTEIEVPAVGRLDALIAQHREARPKKMPTMSADGHGFNAMPQSGLPTTVGLVSRRLVQVEDEQGVPTPWDNVVAMPIEEGRPVEGKERVRFAVAVHRALISLIGTGAPSSITGKYEDGVTIPANRVAIQYLPAGMPVREELGSDAHILLLLPLGMSTADMDVLASGLERLRTLRTGVGKFRLSPDAMFLSGAKFWTAPGAGSERWWETVPAAVPERWMQGRTQADVYRDTAAWSIGNVLRGLPGFDMPRDADKRREGLEGAGLDVRWTRPVVTRQPAHYVHRTNRQTPIMPYRAGISLGSLLPNEAICAIGQSRHLGGGLLVPRDIRSEGETDADR